MRLIYSLLSLSLLGSATPALADSAYKAEDVVRFFTRSAQLGAEKRVCIGSSEECAAMKTAAQPSFDLLVTFDLDSDKLTTGARQNLSEFAKALKDPQLASLRLRVEGHTDARGTDDHNDELSRRRAQAVVSYLQTVGVQTERLHPVGLGKHSPRTNDPFEPINRRVETRIEFVN
jgi:outer membrane protein OmpA-like peptidoglycan-associated protein